MPPRALSASLASLFPAALTLVAFAGCGSQPKGGPTTPDPEGEIGGVVGGAPTEVTAEAVCSRIFELKSQDCGLVQAYELSQDECVADYTRSLEDRGAEARVATQTAGHCLLDNPDCDTVTTCFDQMGSPANDGTATEFRACSQTDVYAPVGVSQADWSKRKGGDVRTFSQHASTKENPIEVCGIPNQMTWLMAVRCDDGSSPFESRDHAHASRVGNVGPGGKCGSIIDLYEVPCPEGTYGIYIDAYVCPVPAGQPVP